jgi:hypothetical protein
MTTMVLGVITARGYSEISAEALAKNDARRPSVDVTAT